MVVMVHIADTLRTTERGSNQLKKLNFSSAIALTALAASIAGPAFAGSSTGTVGVSLNVSAACAVNGGSQTSGSLGQVGTIAFPDQSGVIGTVDATMVPSAGSGGLQVLCTPGLTPALTVGSGAHDSGGLRHLNAGSDTVAYRLYTDAGRSNEIAIGQSISLGTATSSPISVPIYGRITGGGATLPAGAYTDTVQVTLAW